jgi:tRNA modification GTPase
LPHTVPNLDSVQATINANLRALPVPVPRGERSRRSGFRIQTHGHPSGTLSGLPVLQTNLYSHLTVNMDLDTTIAAIATAPGEAGISVIRISGPDSLAIADLVFRGSGGRPSTWPPNTFHHGFLVDPARSVGHVDEVILLVYRAPHSYTGEDTVEIQGHGGRTCSARILQAVLDAGAVAAGPGEFTRRAFMNGRIDLLQAEAVLDLIRARSDRAASAAMEQLDGHLSDSFSRLYDALMHAAADLAATLDFPEEDLPVEAVEHVEQRIAAAVAGMQQMLDAWHEGHLLREGALVVIAGQPNAGKSTLLNKLLRMERAIVAPTAGTTRDTIEEGAVFDGIPVRLVDTAGLRMTECHIEEEGIARARSIMARADIVIYMADGSQPLTKEDQAAIKALPDKGSLVILNKSDLGTAVDESDIAGRNMLVVSIIDDKDVEVARGRITDMLGISNTSAAHATISARHRQYVQNALNDTKAALASCRGAQDDGIVLASTSLREALEQIGRVTGRVYTEDLLDHIFDRFCIGK